MTDSAAAGVTEWAIRIRWPRAGGGENEWIGAPDTDESRVRGSLGFWQGKVPGSTVTAVRRQATYTRWAAAGRAASTSRAVDG